MLRSNLVKSCRNVSQSYGRQLLAGPAFAFGLAMAMGGCSAEFLRFDSPVFGLNGDTTASTRVAEKSTGDTLYDQQPAAPASYSAPPVASVDRSVTEGASRGQSANRDEPRRRIASAQPSVPISYISIPGCSASPHTGSTSGMASISRAIIFRSPG